MNTNRLSGRKGILHQVSREIFQSFLSSVIVINEIAEERRNAHPAERLNERTAHRHLLFPPNKNSEVENEKAGNNDSEQRIEHICIAEGLYESVHDLMGLPGTVNHVTLLNNRPK